jgi:hypothetical protein
VVKSNEGLMTPPALNDARTVGTTDTFHFFFFSAARLRNFSGRNIWFPELAM